MLQTVILRPHRAKPKLDAAQEDFEEYKAEIKI